MKKRVHEIAKERGVSSKAVIDALRAAGVDVKAPASSVEEEIAAKALGANGGDGAAAPAPRPAPEHGRPARASGPVGDGVRSWRSRSIGARWSRSSRRR